MWGDADQQSKDNPQLHSLLMQISGPGHVPREDLRWSDLFHHYNILVHLEEDFRAPPSSSSSSLTAQAGAEMFKNCCHSSNLAALALHAARMVRELQVSCWDLYWKKQATTEETSSHALTTSHASATIALVGRARVTAGVLNVFRVLVHPILVKASSMNQTTVMQGQPLHASNTTRCFAYLQEAFTYTSRADHSFMFHNGLSSTHHRNSIDAASDLISALLSYISMAGNGKSCFIPKIHDQNTFQRISRQTADLTQNIPELYDVVVQCLSLLLTLTSTQLYQPMISTTQLVQDTSTTHQGYQFFLDVIMRLAWEQRSEHLQAIEPPHILYNYLTQRWSAQSILSACLNWFIYRPPPPPRSIASHHSDLVAAVVKDIHIKTRNPSLSSSTTTTTTTTTTTSSSNHHYLGVDGMYETHTIVSACIPSKASLSILTPKQNTVTNNISSGLLQESNTRDGTRVQKTNLHSSFYDLSSSLLLLPLRIFKLALAVFMRHQRLLRPMGASPSAIDLTKILSMKSVLSSGHLDHEPITNDVLWQTDSVVADFACAFFLLLTNNYRAPQDSTSKQRNDLRWYQGNPFQTILALLDDHRWETLLDRGRVMEPDPRLVAVSPQSKTSFTVDFELLFQRFTTVVHNEMGSLMLYTLFLSSPIVTTSFLVRSDLETLVLPLLRTLYMSMTAQHHYSGRTTTANQTEANVQSLSTTVHVLQRPFRSSSQLYVLLILLLIFSQDSSFGPDCFRRTSISSVSWYKERSLKDISLGSLLILTLLRCITFNINRLQDPFLLSNACAVLLNLSPHIYNLHPYSAMRLASVTVSSMKKYAVLCGREAEHDEQSNMHEEVSRCLVNTVKNSLRSSALESNLHLIYSLVYLQRDFFLVTKASKSPFETADIAPIQNVISRAYEVIRSHSSRSADESLTLLRSSIDLLKQNVERNGAKGSDEDFSFAYEEESDPEIFFLPYIWEVIVCAISSSIVDWDKKSIKIFPLLTSLSDSAAISEIKFREDSDLLSTKDGAEMV